MTSPNQSSETPACKDGRRRQAPVCRRCGPTRSHDHGISSGHTERLRFDVQPQLSNEAFKKRKTDKHEALRKHAPKSTPMHAMSYVTAPALTTGTYSVFPTSLSYPVAVSQVSLQASAATSFSGYNTSGINVLGGPITASGIQYGNGLVQSTTIVQPTIGIQHGNGAALSNLVIEPARIPYFRSVTRKNSIQFERKRILVGLGLKLDMNLTVSQSFFTRFSSRTRPDLTTQVLNVIAGGPCDGRDVRTGDVLVGIDDQNLVGTKFEDMMYYFQGEEDTEATLQLDRGTAPHAFGGRS